MELYGRQFVAGPQALKIKSFTRSESFCALKIDLHKQLEVTKVKGPDCELVALGHVIDPINPASSNKDILINLHNCRSFEQLEAAMASLGGRWLLFARIAHEVRLYPDATGSKSVFYSNDSLASQPGLLGHPIVKELSSYPDACTWPMGETPFHGVRQLLPNHYLDLKTFRAIRFGLKPVVKLNLDDAVQVISEILEGTLKAMTSRGTVALPITGGYDSRTLLSAAYGQYEKIDLFTVVDQQTVRHDYVIPSLLAKKVCRPLRFVRPVDEDDIQINTCGLWQDPNQHRISAFAQADIVVLGHLSEICRCFYWKNGVPQHVTAELLSRLAGFDGARQDKFAQWIESVPADLNIDLLDLFYWESRAGNWSSLCCTALDGYCDVISPYNCRRLIEAGLSVDVSHRCQPYELHRKLCRTELRSIPFNETQLERFYAYLSNWIPWRIRVLIKRLTHLEQ